jgi:hypothetical protein
MKEIFRISEAYTTNRDVSTVTGSYIPGRGTNQTRQRNRPVSLYMVLVERNLQVIRNPAKVLLITSSCSK